MYAIRSYYGRALWKQGFEMVEVQTPYLDACQLEELMEKYRDSSPLLSTVPERPKDYRSQLVID